MDRSRFSFPIFFVLTLCSLLLIALPAGAESKKKALSKSAQEKIQRQLDESPGNKIVIFNETGETTGSTTVPKDKAESYGSLPDFLNSADSPKKDCKNPVPTPPPPCIICSSGQVVCSKVSFSGKPRSEFQSPSHSADSKPTAKAPDSEKPQ